MAADNQNVNSPSPISVGVRLLFRQPLIPVAEIAWRWTVAAAAWVLGSAFVVEYLDSLPVTTLDRILLRTGQPLLIGRAFRHIFFGSSFRLVEAGILVGLGLALAWIVVASLGRLVVLRSVFGEFETGSASRHPFRALLFLNFLRVAVTLAATVSAIGSIFMASSLWASTHMRIVDATRIVFLAWFLIWIIWAVWNWLLSTASIFVVIESTNSLAAVGAVLRLLEDRTAGMLAVSTVFAAIHLGALVLLFSMVFVLLPVALASPVILPLIVAGVLVYCLFADCIYIGRLAAYAFLAQGGDQLPRWMGKIRVPPEAIPASIDKDELILSDEPSPA